MLSIIRLQGLNDDNNIHGILMFRPLPRHIDGEKARKLLVAEVVVQNPTESIDHLLDLTKDYHNMLERTVNGESETYTYDSNVVSMSKAGNDYFYMLDELGTGMYLTNFTIFYHMRRKS